MTSRTKDDWRKLIEQHSKGDLSAAEFCKQHQLGQTYFYKRKSDLKTQPARTQPLNYIKVCQLKKAPLDIASIKLQCQHLDLRLRLNISDLAS